VIRVAAHVLLAEVAAVAKALDGGTIEVWDDAAEQPDSPAAPMVGTQLATLSFRNPAFSPARQVGQDAVIVANPITEDANAAADGRAARFRARGADGRAVFDGTISEAGGSGDAVISDVNVQRRGRVRITALTFTQPM
jgi:hypothetical protein